MYYFVPSLVKPTTRKCLIHAMTLAQKNLKEKEKKFKVNTTLSLDISKLCISFLQKLFPLYRSLK